MSEEKQAVDEIIQMERRKEEILARLKFLRGRVELCDALGLKTIRYEQEGEELESELWDILQFENEV